MRTALVLAGAALSAALLWLASPAAGAGYLAPLALAPAGLACLAGSRAAIPVAYTLYLEALLLPALPFGLADDQWADPVLPVLVGGSPVVLAALGVALFGGLLYALRFPTFLPPQALPAWALVGLPALAFTALDLLRTKFDPSGLWGPLYLSQADTPAAPLAGLAGPWLLSFAIAALGFGLALAALRRSPAVLVGVCAAGLAAASAATLVPGGSSGRSAVSVAAVQPGYDTAEFDLPVLHYLRKRYRNLELATRDVVRDLAPLTREAAARGADLVVWPEATAWLDPRSEGPTRRLVIDLARETGVTLVVPWFLRDRGEGATVLVRPDGTVSAPQPKQRPMWFVDEDAGPLEPGRPVDGLGTLLGVDNGDAGIARGLAGTDARLLVSSTHDWAALARQQLAFSRLNAVSVGLPLVRADWRYDSAVVGAGGDVLARAAPGKRRTVVVAAVQTGSPTPYVRIGDAFGWTALVLAVALALGFAQTPRERTLRAPRARLARLSWRRS